MLTARVVVRLVLIVVSIVAAVVLLPPKESICFALLGVGCLLDG